MSKATAVALTPADGACLAAARSAARRRTAGWSTFPFATRGRVSTVKSSRGRL